MHIRLYQESDTLEIIALFTSAVHDIAKKDYNDRQLSAWAPANADLAHWEKRLQNSTTIVAEKNGKIVGFASMTPKGHLDHLYIHPDYQGGLVSIRLFKHIESLARAAGIAYLTTDCSITAKRPAEFMGFVVIKEQIVYRNGVALSNYVMRKKL